MKISLVFSSWTEAFLKEFQDWILDLRSHRYFTPELGIDYFGGRATHTDAATFLKLVGSSIKMYCK